jgi:hypothetical protein
MESPKMSDLSNPQRPAKSDELLSPATQVVRSRADYLGEGTGDVGQRVADDKLELFITTDPAQALLQQFSQTTQEFIVLHDVGGSQALRLLHAVAGALQTKIQQLAIRRVGHGVALAVLPFVELPGRGAQHLRVYCTDIDTDSINRRQLSSVLLGHSRLGVLLVSDMPAHALGNALQPMRDAVAKGPWANRELLLVPLGSASALAAQSSTILGPRGLNVQVTPQAQSNAAAWGFVSGAWNRLRESANAAPRQVDAAPNAPLTFNAHARPPAQHPAAAPAAKPAALSADNRAPSPAASATCAAHDAPTDVMPLAMPSVNQADLQQGRWDGYLSACGGIKGLVSACVFDFRTAKSLAHKGAKPDPDRLVAQGLHLYSVMAESSRALGLGVSQPDAAITLTGHHLLLHPLPGHPGIILHAVLDASIANLTLARMQLQRVDTSELGAVPRH